MDEKQEYENMIDMPINTSIITAKPIKKKRTRKKKDVDGALIKEQLIEKVNGEETENIEKNEFQAQSIDSELEKTEKKKARFTFTMFEGCLIALLVAVILITNAVNTNSGINVFLRGVFKLDKAMETSVDDRVYLEFTPVLNSDLTKTDISEDGSLTVLGKGSAYSVCDGKVSKLLVNENGEYTITISHSDNFSSVIDGLTYCYVKEGDSVYSKVPVGYAKDKEFSMCFLDTDGTIVTGYTVSDNQVVWGV